MRVVYLKTADEDFRWMQKYYAEIFPEGQEQGWMRYFNSIRLIASNPGIGVPYEIEPVRKHPVPNSPFIVYYQQKEDRLEIIRIWDSRRKLESLRIIT